MMTLKEYLKKVCDLEQAVYVKKMMIRKSEDELERVKKDASAAKADMERNFKAAYEKYARTKDNIDKCYDYKRNGWLICLGIVLIIAFAVIIQHFLLNSFPLNITSKKSFFFVMLLTSAPVAIEACMVLLLVLICLDHLDDRWWTTILLYIGIAYANYKYLVPNLGNNVLMRDAILHQTKSMLVIVGVIGLICTALVWLFQTMKYSSLCNKADELKPILLKQKQQAQTLKATIANYNAETVKVVALMQKDILLLNEELKSVSAKLDDMYSLNVIHPKYRHWVAVATIYEYIETGICSSLTGDAGAYKFYEEQLMAKRIVGTLDEISKDVIKYGECVADTQRFIRSSFAAVISHMYGHKTKTYGR